MNIEKVSWYEKRNIDYHEMEAKKYAFWAGFKKVMVRLILIGIAVGAFALYSIYHPVSDAVLNVANVDRREAAREAIELYAEAHPEYTSEEIEEIFRNVVH